MDFDLESMKDKSSQAGNLSFLAIMNENSRPLVQKVLCAGSDPNCGSSSSSSDSNRSTLRAGSDPNGYYSGPRDRSSSDRRPSLGPDMEYRNGCGTSFGKFNCGFGWKDR